METCPTPVLGKPFWINTARGSEVSLSLQKTWQTVRNADRQRNSTCSEGGRWGSCTQTWEQVLSSWAGQGQCPRAAPGRGERPGLTPRARVHILIWPNHSGVSSSKGVLPVSRALLAQQTVLSSREKWNCVSVTAPEGGQRDQNSGNSPKGNRTCYFNGSSPATDTTRETHPSCKKKFFLKKTF